MDQPPELFPMERSDSEYARNEIQIAVLQS